MCTGITLIAQDGSAVYGRTMEWGSFDLVSRLAIVPPGTPFQGSIPPPPPALLPGSYITTSTSSGLYTTTTSTSGLNTTTTNRHVVDDEPRIRRHGRAGEGQRIRRRYEPGWPGLRVVLPPRVRRRTRTMILECRYLVVRRPTWSSTSLVSALRSRRCARRLANVHVVPVPEHALGDIPAPVHFMVVEPSGSGVVVEFLDGKMHLFDAPLRVITNSPEYPWHMTNLRNYVNLSPVALPTGSSGA